MSPHASPKYAPLNTSKQVDDNIWIVDGGKINFYGLPFSTRMTIVRLGNGNLFVHSPVAPTPELLEEVSQLGRVAHLVSPNWIHYAFIAEWAAAFPGAKCWASPNVRNRAAKYSNHVQFDQDLDERPDPAWALELEQLIVHGSTAHVEVVFFHTSSRTLILTDLIENFEIGEIPFLLRWLYHLGGIVHPKGAMPRDMRASFARSRPILRDAVETMIAWNPKRIILSHGLWYRENGVAELKRAFKWVLK